MGIPIYQVDAFTNHMFAGNPAAVCIPRRPVEADWMQSVAAEMNLSETAFVVSQDNGFSLRWFTPAVEVDLCGHATLATAHVLWETGRVPSDQPARFQTRSGELIARQVSNGIELDFPAIPVPPGDAPDGMFAALGVEARFIGRPRSDILIEVDSEDTVRSLRPDIKGLSAAGVRGVIVTARSASPDWDFVSRFFAPGAGVDEDPVTGSAHCALAPYWAEQLGKQEMIGYQASKRGGVVGVRLAGDRVILSGQAVTVLHGELCAGS